MRRLALLATVIALGTVALWLALGTPRNASKALTPERDALVPRVDVENRIEPAIAVTDGAQAASEDSTPEAPTRAAAHEAARTTAQTSRWLSLAVEARTSAGARLEFPAVHVTASSHVGQEVRALATPLAEFHDLADGVWRVDATGEGLVPASIDVEVLRHAGQARATIALAPESLVAVRFETPDGVLLRDVDPEFAAGLRVIADELPLPEYVVDRPPLSPASLFGIGSWTRRAPDSIASLMSRTQSNGVLALRVEPPVWVGVLHGSALLATRRLEKGTNELAFSIDPSLHATSMASIAWRVVGSHHQQALESHQVSLQQGFEPETEAREFAADSGEWSGLVPRSVVLTFEAAGVRAKKVRFDLEPGKRLDVGDIALAPLSGPRYATLDGRFLPMIFDRKPYELMLYQRTRDSSRSSDNLEVDTTSDLSRLVLELVIPRPDGRWSAPRSVARTSCSKDGTFQMTNVPSELYVLRARQGTCLVGYWWIDLTRKVERPIHLVALRSSTVLLRWPADVDGGSWVAIETLSEAPVLERMREGSTLEVDLLPGKYVARRMRGEGKVAETSFEVRPGRSTVDLR